MNNSLSFFSQTHNGNTMWGQISDPHCTLQWSRAAVFWVLWWTHFYLKGPSSLQHGFQNVDSVLSEYSQCANPIKCTISGVFIQTYGIITKRKHLGVEHGQTNLYWLLHYFVFSEEMGSGTAKVCLLIHMSYKRSQLYPETLLIQSVEIRHKLCTYWYNCGQKTEVIDYCSSQHILLHPKPMTFHSFRPYPSTTPSETAGFPTFHPAISAYNGLTVNSGNLY